MINYFSLIPGTSFLPVINKELSYHQIFLVHFVIGAHFLASKKYGSGGDEHEGLACAISRAIPQATYFLLHVARSCNNMTRAMTHAGRDIACINVSRA